MIKFLKKPTHKLVFIIIFFLLIYISLYEFWWSNITSSNWLIYKAGIITSLISYSIIAACIFYIFTQYLGVELPKQNRKVKIILPYIYRQARVIDGICETLKFHLKINGNDFKDIDKFSTVLANIKVDEPIGEFNNWHHYLYHIKTQIFDVNRGIYYYNEYLDENFLHEIIIIESILMSPITFIGYKKLACTDLSYAVIDLQEILIHNQHLQTIKQKGIEKYKKEFELAEKEYRETYYADVK